MKIVVIFIVTVFCGITKLIPKSIVKPIIMADFGGGNSYYEGKSSSFGGNFVIDIAPVIIFNERLALLLYYKGNYQGIKSFTRLAEGGSLYQQTQNHLFLIKLLIKKQKGLKFKTKIGYKKELVRETKDESWGDGLYDYDRYNLGIEWEKRKVRFGYNFYYYQFPNYWSLASKIGLSQPGEDIYDHISNEIFWSRDGRINLEMYLVYKYFLDQYIVEETALYSNRKRWDINFEINLERFYLIFKKIFMVAGLSLTYNHSNQNYFDVRELMFIPNFYDYIDGKFSISFNKKYKKFAFSFGYSFGYRKYIERLIQDIKGEYKPEKLNQKIQIFSLSIVYPLRRNLEIELQGNWQIALSNMEYEEFYKYSYSAGNWLTSINWRY
ncbi:MAG: hypothetical protein DRI36_02930 [Caldiserica bacterium]|nr:MAG: hypothetical protein DRI36_02930 [Caldisericota bacterium]